MSSNMKRAVRGSIHKPQSNSFVNQTIHSRSGVTSKSTTKDEIMQPNGARKESGDSTVTKPTVLAPESHRHDPDLSTIRSSTSWPLRASDISTRVERAVRPSSDTNDADYGTSSGIHGLEYQSRRKVLRVPRVLKTRKLSHTLSNITDRSGNDVNACPETPILLMGKSKEVALLLEKSMRLAYSQNFSKAEKEACRISILHDVVHSMRGLLLSMKDTGIPLHDTSSDLHAFVILTSSSTTDWKYLPKEISNAVTMLWNDQSVVKAFNSVGLRCNGPDLR